MVSDLQKHNDKWLYCAESDTLKWRFEYISEQCFLCGIPKVRRKMKKPLLFQEEC